MISIDELYSELKALTAKVEKLREEQTAEVPTTNFREIEAVASRYPISGHPMFIEDEHTKRMYMLMLMSVIVLDPDKYTESFMTFYRIAAGMGYKCDVSMLMLSANNMRFEIFDEITRLFAKDDKKLLLLLECMLIAAQFDKGKRKGMEYIAKITAFLDIDKLDITGVANLANVILTNNLKRIDLPYRYYALFCCYISINEIDSNLQNNIQPRRYSDSDDYYKHFNNSNNKWSS